MTDRLSLDTEPTSAALARHDVACARPRSWQALGDKLVKLCQEARFTQEAYYAMAGRLELSVGFAEQVQCSIGNLYFDDEPERMSSGVVFHRVTLTDLESNTTLSEIYPVHLAAAPGVRRRDVARVRAALVLTLLPSYVRESCLRLCQATARKEYAVHLPEVSKDVVTALVALGVEVAAIKSYLGHPPAALTVAEVEQLRSAALLIRDGETTWEQLAGQQRLGAALRKPEQPQAEPKKPAAKKKAPRAAKAAAASPKPAETPRVDPSAPRPSLRDDPEEGATPAATAALS